MQSDHLLNNSDPVITRHPVAGSSLFSGAGGPWTSLVRGALAAGLATLLLAGTARAAVQTGYLTVNDAVTGANLGYVGLFDSGGLYHTTTDPSQALQVSIDNAGAPFSITELNNPASADFPFFGGVQGLDSTGNDFAAGSSNYAIIVGVTRTLPGAPAVLANNSFTPFFAPVSTPRYAESAVWSLSSTNVLTPQWINSDGARPVTSLVLSEDIFLAGTSIFVLTGDPAQSQTIFGPGPTVNLSFVPGAIPEPSTLAMLLAGLVPLAYLGRARFPRVRQTVSRCLSLSTLAVITLLIGAGQASAQTFTTTGSIDNNDPVETGRIFRDGNPSVAGINKAYPGTANANLSFHYDEYTFTNVNPFAEVVTITLNTTVVNQNLPFSGAYLTSFDPASIAANYRGDEGFSSGGTPNSYSITVPASTIFDVIVNESFSGMGVANYTLSVAQVPEPSTQMALALGCAWLAVGLLRSRGKRQLSEKPTRAF